MVYLSGLVLLALTVLAEARVGPSNESLFCTETKECLEFDMVCKTSEYEVRHYGPTKWVSTEVDSYFMEVAMVTAFRRLFKYITGANEGGIMIAMTSPVPLKVMEKKKMWLSATYTMSFLLPSAYQEQAPAPTDDKVYLTTWTDMDVYVRSYGGWMGGMVNSLQSALLTKELDRVGASYDKEFHYAVGYDSPRKILNRHNEVWYIVEGDPVCSEPADSA